MKQLTNLLSIILIASVLILSACSGGSKKVQDDSSVVSSIKKEKIKSDVSEFVYPLPTAFEVTKMLNRIGASYILSISNPAEDAEKYFTEKSKALNLGIYGADLSYASTYNQKQIAMDYMNASDKLISELGFEDAIDKTIPEKIEAAENNKDTIIEIITNTFYSTYEFLNKNNRGSVSVLVLTGTWVEGLYIATHISEDTYNNKEMVKIIMDQKAPLETLMGIIKDNESNADVASAGKMLEKLYATYNSIDEGSITQQQMIDITNEVAEVRSAIVK